MMTPTVQSSGIRLSPSEQTVVSIVLVDDHAIVRQGIRSILERQPQMSVVGEAATSEEAMRVVSLTRPRMVLLDLKLSTASDTEGLDLCQRLTSTFPDTAVLVLTTLIDDQLVVRAIRSGASGYVVKDVDTRELVNAILAVSQGESAFDARSAAAMVRSLNSRSPLDSQQLTGREREVLSLLARGLSNREIGKRLYVSTTTAKFHVGNIIHKLNVTRRAEAVYAASKMGLI
jgi:DNA-binding NarL/FixJ family response regulator